MIIITLLSLTLSAIALIIVLKERSRRPYAGDLEDFRAETERLIAEFNRVAERNIGMLDERIDLAQKETRRCFKSEEKLKRLIEEARVLDALDLSEEENPKEAFAYAEDLSEEDTFLERPEIPSDNLLFDGFIVDRIKNYAKHRNSPIKKHEMLLQYLKENKEREELIELGFSQNEISLALLNLASERSLDNNKP